MKRILYSVFIVFLFIACAHPNVKTDQGEREYGLKPNQTLKIDKIENNFVLDREALLTLIEMTDEEIEQLKEILSEISFNFNIDQTIGDFEIDVGVDKRSQEQYDQDATQKTNISPDIKVIP